MLLVLGFVVSLHQRGLKALCKQVYIGSLVVLEAAGYHSELNLAMSTSCENKRTQAYSPDLRWRMVYQALVLEKTSREIAQNLNVDQSTVSRTVKLFNEQGDVATKSYPENFGTKKLYDLDQLILLELVVDNPGIRLHEL